jgi:peptidoglycan/LPS O-acetylase OafA/YrhL
MDPAISVSAAPRRRLFIDLIRVLSCLYIVAYWHLRDYVDRGPDRPVWLQSNLVLLLVVSLCLGAFTFISAYFIGKKEKFDSANHCIGYLKKRFIRIYPPYLLAIACFSFMHIEKLNLLTEGALLISMFSAPVPKTLWFITMLIVLNLISPLMLAPRRSLIKIASMGLLLWLCFLVYSFLGGGLDYRMLLYMPPFILGLMVGYDEGKMTRPRVLWGALFVFVVGLFLLPLAFESKLLGTLARIPAGTAGCLLIFEGFRRMEAYLQGAAKPIIFLSYSSFCMYLFHRPVMQRVMMFYHPETPTAQFFYMFAVGVPLTIALAWFIQFAYDRAIAASSIFFQQTRHS